MTDYKNTLNLPKTEFPMKANLAEQEPKRLQKWEENNVYDKIQQSRNGCPEYILHDGPPYANGNIHIGTALNKILKDFIIKIKTGQGFKSPYVPGWDCHGLPIELKVDQELGEKKKDMTVAQIRKVCRNYAGKYIDIQRTDFKRLGVFGVWDKPYITMDFEYEATTLAELYKCYKKGEVYKGSKPVYWCHSCVTALAEAEVEYADHTSTSVFVKFPLDDEAKNKIGVTGTVSAVIWTTTPWTLPANVAIAVNRDYEYSIIKINAADNSNLSSGEYIIVAKEMLENLAGTFKITGYDEVKIVKGSELEYLNARHPFYERNSMIVLADYVTLDAGTGLVHTAPGHGQDDYETGLRYNLDILSPVDDNGVLRNVGIFDGMHINKANKEIVAYMQEHGSLLAQNDISHSYPHCWRCKKPVIFRATPQWFISMSENGLRERTLDAIKNKVKWIPSWGQNRIQSMVENRPDWCISRQRLWGVPIAFITCHDCGEIIFNDDIEKTTVEAFKKEGADAWFEHDEAFFLNGITKCPKCGSTHLKKEKDILDVWFDSGTSHAAVCEKRPELGKRANMYLEGSDQHRGWFQSSIIESMATRGVPPFDEVLTHGFVVDGSGRKMSKSLGNTVAPMDIINKYGTEILRLWVAAEDYTEDVRISEDIIKRITESYRKIRNTARYILGNLSDFDPDKDMIEYDKLMELDKNILGRWQLTKAKIYDAYNTYQFHGFYHGFLNFCINDLSSFYLDIIKDRAYSSKNHSYERRSAQTAMFTLIKEIAVVINPVLSFTADEIWEYLPKWNDKKEFVFEEFFPKVEDYKIDYKWSVITNVRKEVNKALEIARADKVIGHPLDAEVVISVSEDMAKHLTVDEGLERMFIVSKAVVVTGDIEKAYVSEDGQIKVLVQPCNAPKCARCWTHSETVGKDEAHPEVCQRCAEALK